MYQSPKLVRFGQFRDLTLQTQCTGGGLPKNQPINDPTYPLGNTNDGPCIDPRS